jgi:hypothetical protein
MTFAISATAANFIGGTSAPGYSDLTITQIGTWKNGDYKIQCDVMTVHGISPSEDWVLILPQGVSGSKELYATLLMAASSGRKVRLEYDGVATLGDGSSRTAPKLIAGYVLLN